MSTSLLIEAPAADANLVRLYVPLELSKSKWLVGIHSPDLGGGKHSRHVVAGGDWVALAGLIEAAKQRLAGRGRQVRVVCCYEAGYEGFWLARRLEQLGYVCLVLDAASIEVNRRRRRAKTDRLDIERLLRVLMALERGEKKACSVVRVPSVEAEDAKDHSRERQTLVNERTRHSNRIKGLLLKCGIREGEPRRKDFLARLDEMVTGDGRPLPARLKARLGREHAMLMLVIAQLAEVEAERDSALAAPAAHGSSTAKVRNLIRLRGFGPGNSVPLVDEVFYRDFSNRRQVGGYTGLTPTPFQSGTIDRDQGIDKTGNPRARTMLIETAWLWLRHQPDSELSRWFFERTGPGRGRVRRIAIAALARKLAVALWRYLETGLVPRGAVFKKTAGDAHAA